ncbi:hypothetical protein LIMHP_11195 [Leptospira interrogans serovar Manilae]|nr:hypothetical protein LIMLP_11190 [Leptospira interrogans serovar Manilae]AKP31569.1 hypothetical protein LIMHP_11195 [Leptospira interrogans serovar Manilae]EYU62812.1 hypothetical protein CI00_18035 [Leptospira interrogans serovar Manilae]
MSIDGSGCYKKQTDYKTYEYQKFLHGFPVSIFQNQTEKVQAYTVNLIFQRISEIDSIEILLFITLGMIFITRIKIQRKEIFITNLGARTLSLNSYFNVSSIMIHSSEESLDPNFIDRFLKCGNYHKLRFVCKIMWELSQITILRTNSKIVGTHTFRKFFLN